MSFTWALWMCFRAAGAEVFSFLFLVLSLCPSTPDSSKFVYPVPGWLLLAGPQCVGGLPLLLVVVPGLFNFNHNSLPWLLPSKFEMPSLQIISKIRFWLNLGVRGFFRSPHKIKLARVLVFSLIWSRSGWQLSWIVVMTIGEVGVGGKTLVECTDVLT